MWYDILNRLQSFHLWHWHFICPGTGGRSIESTGRATKDKVALWTKGRRIGCHQRRVWDKEEGGKFAKIAFISHFNWASYAQKLDPSVSMPMFQRTYLLPQWHSCSFKQGVSNNDSRSSLYFKDKVQRFGMTESSLAKLAMHLWHRLSLMTGVSGLLSIIKAAMFWKLADWGVSAKSLNGIFVTGQHHSHSWGGAAEQNLWLDGVSRLWDEGKSHKFKARGRSQEDTGQDERNPWRPTPPADRGRNVQTCYLWSGIQVELPYSI